MKHRVIAILLLALCAPLVRAADTPEDILKEALTFEKANDSAKAAQLFSDFLKKFPEHTQASDAHFRLGKALENLGSVDDAIKEYQAVVQSDKKQYRGRQDAFYSLGKLYASVSQHDKAIDTFEKMLAEGAGVYEDEVQNLCSGWYAVKGKYDEAAAKLNILKRKKDSPLAEQASYKLAVLWLKAEKLDFAISAIEDLAANFPKNKHVPELLLQLADVYRKQKKFEKAIAVAEQLKASYPKSPEALGGGYILGLCARDNKDFKKAVAVFESIGRVPEFRKRGLAAEALVQAAEIYFADLAQTQVAIDRYAEAAMSARDSDSERKNELLEQCYFHIAEYYFTQKKWSIALENYMLLRGAGTKLNITGRILACQAALDEKGSSSQTWSAEDIEAVRKKIADNPSTDIAAEGDVFLADRKFQDALKSKRGTFSSVIDDYKAILKKYNKEILAKNSLESYVHVQLGVSLANGQTRADAAEAVKEFEAAIAVDPNTPYKLNALESIAIYSELAGDKKKSYDTYQKLYELAGKPADPSAKTGPNPDAAKSVDYLKAMVTRTDGEELTLKTLSTLKKIIEEKGQLSDEAREARFYMGELFFVKRDFSAAAKAYREFVVIYGPKQDANGDIATGPWKPSIDSKVKQVYEAAARIAHSWYMQGHEQNMIAAYKWIVKNFPHNNKFTAEAQYWLSMELTKGKAAETKEGKRAAAEALWKNVVHPQLPSPVSEKNYRSQYYKWTDTNDPDFDDVKKYVKTAMLKSGQYFSESGDHAMAANCFAAYIDRFPIDHAKHSKQRRKNDPNRNDPNDEAVDEQYQIARYALGREYVALGETAKVVETFKPYIGSMRDDKFRVSALKLLGFHGSKGGQVEDAIEAYATLLDEYGSDTTNEKGLAIPLPQRERLRSKSLNWDGYRIPPPKDLDLGEIRFALGFLYWKQEQWDKAAQTLAPFALSSDLRENKSRDRALFMAAQSAFKINDYQAGLRALQPLLKDYPKFEAFEEASVFAARGFAETKNWSELELACKTFRADFPRSDRRPRIDYFAALAQIGQGKVADGIAAMKSLAGSETFEDVRADACYQIALFHLTQKPENLQAAFELLEKSVKFLATDKATLELGKCAMKLQKWDIAKDALNKTVREFPKSAQRGEAEQLLAEVQKKLASKK